MRDEERRLIEILFPRSEKLPRGFKTSAAHRRRRRQRHFRRKMHARFSLLTFYDAARGVLMVSPSQCRLEMWKV